VSSSNWGSLAVRSAGRCRNSLNQEYPVVPHQEDSSLTIVSLLFRPLRTYFDCGHRWRGQVNSGLAGCETIFSV